MTFEDWKKDKQREGYKIWDYVSSSGKSIILWAKGFEDLKEIGELIEFWEKKNDK